MPLGKGAGQLGFVKGKEQPETKITLFVPAR